MRRPVRSDLTGRQETSLCSAAGILIVAERLPCMMPALDTGLLTPLERPAVVLDCGTGYTKLGFSGNSEASCEHHLQCHISRLSVIKLIVFQEHH